MSAGDFERAREVQGVVNDVIDELLRISPGVVPGIKHGLRQLVFNLGEARRPFLAITADTSRFDKLLLSAEGFEHCKL